MTLIQKCLANIPNLLPPKLPSKCFVELLDVVGLLAGRLKYPY